MPKELREPFILIATGMTGVGKTYTTEREMRMYVHGDSQAMREPRKALIFDTNDEYRQYSTVYFDVTKEKGAGMYLSQLDKPEIRRILPYKKDGTPMTFAEKEKTLVEIMTYYRNGLVVLEDINTYLVQAKSVDTISMLTANRHKGLDVIIHYQSLSALDPRMWQNTTIIRMHNQSDDIVRYKSRIPNFELMKIAQNIVSNEYVSGNTRFYVYVNIRTNKIRGCTVDQYKKAVFQYHAEYRKLSPNLQISKFLYLDTEP